MKMMSRNNNNDVKVGDTPADTVMGKAAGVGLNVGVLRFTGTYRITLLVSETITFRITLFKQCHHFNRGLLTPALAFVVTVQYLQITKSLSPYL